MGISQEKLNSPLHFQMALVSVLFVGTVVGICILATSLMGVTRNSGNKGPRQETRKSSHVTEVLQVDMVDRRIRLTSLDCNLEMEEVVTHTCPSDQVLSPVPE